ncbi:MAG: ABC transporter ATP-binding protein/permease [Crocinitomicaceae bacterium]|nr:ABC transporter ATP-binding protein/permease [Crocinitomicaceae bacterium]MDP4866127.1 ABC transporter ATP-binding protein/permease [Crocinitomicaceae bacterium]MDP5011767.1 ABC transporter ATP-binding protein/permease [Crocinitomicaceae bacterium]
MKSLSYLNKYFIKYKWRLLLGTLFIVISNYFGVRMPIFVKDAVDQFMNTVVETTPDDTLIMALKLGGLYMFLSICSGFFLFLTRQTIIVMSRLIEYDLKNEIYDQYQRLDYGFYKQNSTGDLMNRISEDVSQVRMYLGPGIMYTINLVALSALVIYQMIKISPSLTLFVLLPLPLMSFLIYKVSSKMNSLSKDVQVEQSFMSTLAQETFSGIRVVKAYSREKELHNKFNKSADNYKSKNMRLVMVNSLFMPTIVFLIGLSTVLTIYLGGLMSYDGSITPGGIVAIIFFVNKLTWPFASVGWVTSINQRAAASQERINQFLKIKPNIVNTKNESEFNFKGNIEFKNVTYVYPNSGIIAIKNLSFEIKPNNTLAIIGHTGSGKSTILNLLMRNIDPDSGEILIDGVNLKDINLDAFRRQAGIVPQEVFLFSDTIGNNIKFGTSDGIASQELIEDVARKAYVLHNIEQFPDKFETLLGERGVNLSGGQKQRVSIARALIRNPKLLLLDDCLSAVDTQTEEIILGNLKTDIDQKTTLIVSHRISSLRNADKLILLDNGEKVEEGSHADLMALNGQYASIYAKQLTEQLD